MACGGQTLHVDRGSACPHAPPCPRTHAPTHNRHAPAYSSPLEGGHPPIAGTPLAQPTLRGVTRSDSCLSFCGSPHARHSAPPPPLVSRRPQELARRRADDDDPTAEETNDPGDWVVSNIALYAKMQLSTDADAKDALEIARRRHADRTTIHTYLHGDDGDAPPEPDWTEAAAIIFLGKNEYEALDEKDQFEVVVLFCLEHALMNTLNDMDKKGLDPLMREFKVPTRRLPPACPPARPHGELGDGFDRNNRRLGRRHLGCPASCPCRAPFMCAPLSADTEPPPPPPAPDMAGGRARAGQG